MEYMEILTAFKNDFLSKAPFVLIAVTIFGCIAAVKAFAGRQKAIVLTTSLLGVFIGFSIVLLLNVW